MSEGCVICSKARGATQLCPDCAEKHRNRPSDETTAAFVARMVRAHDAAKAAQPEATPEMSQEELLAWTLNEKVARCAMAPIPWSDYTENAKAHCLKQAGVIRELFGAEEEALRKKASDWEVAARACAEDADKQRKRAEAAEAEAKRWKAEAEENNGAFAALDGVCREVEPNRDFGDATITGCAGRLLQEQAAEIARLKGELEDKTHPSASRKSLERLCTYLNELQAPEMHAGQDIADGAITVLKAAGEQVKRMREQLEARSSTPPAPQPDPDDIADLVFTIHYGAQRSIGGLSKNYQEDYRQIAAQLVTLIRSEASKVLSESQKPKPTASRTDPGEVAGNRFGGLSPAETMEIIRGDSLGRGIRLLEGLIERIADERIKASQKPKTLDEVLPTASRPVKVGDWVFWRRCPEPVQDAPVESADDDGDLPSVTGRMERTIAQHVHACRVLIREEQAKPDPDNGLISVLCDAVRLAAEYCETKAGPVQGAPVKVGDWVVLRDESASWFWDRVNTIGARGFHARDNHGYWWFEDKGKTWRSATAAEIEAGRVLE